MGLSVPRWTVPAWSQHSGWLSLAGSLGGSPTPQPLLGPAPWPRRPGQPHVQVLLALGPHRLARLAWTSGPKGGVWQAFFFFFLASFKEKIIHDPC